VTSITTALALVVKFPSVIDNRVRSRCRTIRVSRVRSSELHIAQCGTEHSLGREGKGRPEKSGGTTTNRGP
jgi:hypothetical protein